MFNLLQLSLILVYWFRVRATTLDGRGGVASLSGSSVSQSYFALPGLFKASANGLCLKAGRM